MEPEVEGLHRRRLLREEPRALERIPNCAGGPDFPGFLEPRWIAEKALTAVVMRPMHGG